MMIITLTMAIVIIIAIKQVVRTDTKDRMIQIMSVHIEMVCSTAG